jgi:hypothetical protein
VRAVCEWEGGTETKTRRDWPSIVEFMVRVSAVSCAQPPLRGLSNDRHSVAMRKNDDMDRLRLKVFSRLSRQWAGIQKGGDERGENCDRVLPTAPEGFISRL